MKPRKSFRFSKTSVAEVQWFLAGGMAVFMFFALVRQSFSKAWFDLPAILMLALLSTVIGFVFANLWTYFFTKSLSSNDFQSPSEPKRSESSKPNGHIKKIDIPLQDGSLTWIDQVHVTILELTGSRLRVLKVLCMSIAVIAPITVFALKLRSISGSTLGVIDVAILILIGGAAALATIGVTIIVLAAMKTLLAFRPRSASTLRLSEMGPEILHDRGVKHSFQSLSAIRVVETTRVIGFELNFHFIGWASKTDLGEDLLRDVREWFHHAAHTKD